MNMSCRSTIRLFVKFLTLLVLTGVLALKVHAQLAVLRSIAGNRSRCRCLMLVPVNFRLSLRLPVFAVVVLLTSLATLAQNSPPTIPGSSIRGSGAALGVRNNFEALEGELVSEQYTKRLITEGGKQIKGNAWWKANPGEGGTTPTLNAYARSSGVIGGVNAHVNLIYTIELSIIDDAIHLLEDNDADVRVGISVAANSVAGGEADPGGGLIQANSSAQASVVVRNAGGILIQEVSDHCALAPAERGACLPSPHPTRTDPEEVVFHTLQIPPGGRLTVQMQVSASASANWNGFGGTEFIGFAVAGAQADPYFVIDPNQFFEVDGVRRPATDFFELRASQGIQHIGDLANLPAPGLFNISRKDDGMEIAATVADPGGTRIMESADPANPLSWQTLEVAPEVYGMNLTAFTEASPPIRFFRLHDFGSFGDPRVAPPYYSHTVEAPDVLPTETIVPLQEITFEGHSALTAVPEFPQAIAFLIHDEGEGVGMASDPVMTRVINRYLRDRMAVVITESGDRAEGRWDVINTTSATNPDVSRLLGLWQRVVADSELDTEMPLYTFGFGHGAHFALHYADIASQEGRPVKASCVASLPVRVVNRVNAILGDPDRSYRVFVTANGGDLQTSHLFQQQSGEFQFTGPEFRMGRSSFASINGLSVSDSAAIIGALRNAGIIDGRGVRRIGQDTVDDAFAALAIPARAAGFEGEIRAVLDDHFARNPKFSSFVDDLGLMNLKWIRE